MSDDIKSVKRYDLEVKYYSICPYCDEDTVVEYEEIENREAMCENCNEVFKIEY